MRRRLMKLFFGASFSFIILSPFECTFHYCQRHSFNPPICDGLFPE